LLAHLTKEDKQLYPPLYEKAQSDLSFKKTLDTFGAEMEKITEFVLDFYQKYLDINNISKTEFIKDLSTFIVALKNRIMKEEVAIYKAYEKLKLD
jgi:hemerythrin-like domain-containing protein